MGDINIKDNRIVVKLLKKRQLPAILELTANYNNLKFPWLNNCNPFRRG